MCKSELQRSGCSGRAQDSQSSSHAMTKDTESNAKDRDRELWQAKHISHQLSRTFESVLIMYLRRERRAWERKGGQEEREKKTGILGWPLAHRLLGTSPWNVV